jgi:hypothetical protein
MGSPAGERIPDGWIWAEFWTRYFTDRQWRHSWVAQRAGDGAVVGYLTGTEDVRRFDAYTPFLLPGIVARVVRRRLIRRPDSRRAILAMLHSLVAGELDLPPAIARHYPATFHADLLGEARSLGLGRAMFALFIERMRQLRVPGVHAQPLSVNEPIQRFLVREGFRLVGSTPCGAFSHADPRPIRILTYVLDL